MSKPTWAMYFSCVGGVLAIFAVAIFAAREYYPGSEGYVVIGVSIIGIGALATKERWSSKRAVKKSDRKRRNRGKRPS